MTEVLVFADAVQIVCDYLRDELDDRGSSAVVGSRVPSPRPAQLVMVRRTGGPRRNLVVDDAQLTVECWAATEQDAHDLTQLCRALIYAAPGAAPLVRRVEEFSGPALLPDPLTDSPRYVQTFAVSVRWDAS